MKALSLVVAVVLALSASDAGATKQFDRAEIQARFSVQNSFQHDGSRNFDWVQQRNEIRFELTYDLIRKGEEVAGFNKAKVNLLYRGRYDSVFDARESYRRRGYDRNDFRFPEGKTPRELFLDLGFSGPLSPFSMRIGRQQVVWGEADLFRSLDVVNPLRIDQNGIVGEDFSDYREPLWIAKFLWDIGELGPIANTGLEFFYSPDGRPFADRTTVIAGEVWRIGADENNLLTGFNRNTMLPFQQVRHPWELIRVGNRRTDAPATVQNADGSFSDFFYQIPTDTPRNEVDFARSMVGVRLLGTTIGNANFTLNYLYKRTDGAGSAIPFEDLFDKSQPGTGAVRGDILNEAVGAAMSPDGNGNGIPDGQEEQIRKCILTHEKKAELILDPHLFGRNDVTFNGSVRSDPRNPRLNTGASSTACLDIPHWHPWTHIVGGTLTYNDYDYTGFVWRLEQSLSTKEPGNGISPNNPSRLAAGQGVPSQRDFDTHGMRTTQVWRSMFGFDYLSSLAPEAGRSYPQPFRSLLTDQWFMTFQFLNEYHAHANGQSALSTSFTDRVQHFNPLLTFGMSGFFLQSRFRPYLAAAYEVNQAYPLFILQGDYNLTNELKIRIGEVIYAGSQNAEANSFLNYYADRDTTYVRMTYYFM
jgi:hypothetical protein